MSSEQADRKRTETEGAAMSDKRKRLDVLSICAVYQNSELSTKSVGDR